MRLSVKASQASRIGQISSSPNRPEFYLFWLLTTVDAWAWPVFMLMIGQRRLNFSNRWLQYGQEAVLPFFVLHQPVIMVGALFVVQ